MKRTRATQLALVNWRGVFYERYELSDTVTALEGANGAGKTTVLVAAFVVLLPDMNHLRFTNVGETTGGGGDRGIWGRLGKMERPSYAVLDIALADGERLVAGVHLERRSEPAVELTPFLITDFPHGEKLQELLLVRGNDLDAVPEIEELRQQAAHFGAELQKCATAKEYFRGLFKRGVTPLHLDGDRERTKVAEMLRTSMSGGMSRVLTNGLRGFLLKEERGLADILKRMRSSIDACRRTRAEVDDARTLEGVISRVYEAGQEMFNAAVHATEQASQEAVKRIADGEENVRRADTAVKAAQSELGSAKDKHKRARRNVDELEEALKRESTDVQRLEAGRALQRRIERVEAEIESARRERGWHSDVSTTDEVEALRSNLSEQRDAILGNADRLRQRRQALEEERQRIAEAGASLSREVGDLAHKLGGETVAERFEDIAIEDAGVQEARLGPLVNAIVVDDPQRCARTAAEVRDRPESVWLTKPRAIADPTHMARPEGERIGNAVIAPSSEDVWRITDIPERPVLGRRARERKLAALKREVEEVGNEVRQLETQRGEVEAALGTLEDLRLKVVELDRARHELIELRIADVSDTAVTKANAELAALQREHKRVDDESRRLDKQLGRLEGSLEQANRDLEQTRGELADHRTLGEPAQRRWDQLHAKADSDGLLGAPFAPEAIERFAGRGSGNLYSEALSWARRVHDRLSQAEPEGEIGKKIDDLCRLDERSRSGDDYLRAWREVRVWLHRRIPAQVAQMDDPLEALTRLRSHLAELEKRLATQERDLQGNTADVANAIGTQTRDARREVERLNKDLENVRFGSIAGVRLQLGRVREMENVLEALRTGDGQGSLFTPDLPLEEALNELFRKFAGRRAQGYRLLDYREYVDPVVEVRRKAGTGWETANSTRISTGESIGIGAALMMVVLTAWERGASLLRAQSAQGTLRLLLLDEANRLDRENLAVLFDLCRNLQLQLMVAAPEVAQAEGNTTYRLVRVSDGDKEEEVRVTGRRVVAEATA